MVVADFGDCLAGVLSGSGFEHVRSSGLGIANEVFQDFRILPGMLLRSSYLFGEFIEGCPGASFQSLDMVVTVSQPALLEVS